MNITKLAILTLFSYLPLSAMEFSEQALIKPNAQRIRNEAIIACNNLGKVKIYHDDGMFKVKHNKAVSTVASHDTDSFLRKLNSDQLHAFLEKGAIKVKQLNNGDFTINAYNRGFGGGYFTGQALYWGTKLIGYGVPAAVATVTVGAVAAPIAAAAGVGGTAAGVAGVATTATECIGVVTSSLVTGGTVTGSAALVTGQVVVAGVGTEVAATGVGATLAAGGFTIGGYVSAVETTATIAGAIGTACIWLP
jgi:hypothetical protein